MPLTSQLSMFGMGDQVCTKRSRMHGEIVDIDYDIASDFLIQRHYSGRVPTISRAFGWYVNGQLKAVCTFGKPASNSLCESICGKEYADNVYELNRLCREDDFKEPLSAFVSACLRRLRINRWIIVSFSDTAMNHHGYIYQACNFIYTGETKERRDVFVGEGKHARHYTKEDMDSGLMTIRSAKHRYVYFATYLKAEKKKWKDALRFPVLPYPKGDNNPDYKLGEVLKQTVVER